MKHRDAVARRIFVRLRNQFEARGWAPADGASTMLVMRASPSVGVEQKLLIQEPLGASELPSTNLLGLSCAVNIVFEEIETLLCAVAGHGIQQSGQLSGRLVLCQLLPKNTCYLGNVYLVDPSDEGASLARLLADYDKYLEPLRKRLGDVSVFDDPEFGAEILGRWAWAIRHAAYLYLKAKHDSSLAYYESVITEAGRVINHLGRSDRSGKPLETTAGLLDESQRRGAEEAMRVVSTLRQWISSGRPKPAEG